MAVVQRSDQIADFLVCIENDSRHFAIQISLLLSPRLVRAELIWLVFEIDALILIDIDAARLAIIDSQHGIGLVNLAGDAYRWLRS